MQLEAASASRQYLYAVIGGGAEREWDVRGIGGSAVRSVTEGRVSAVVSDLSWSSIRPERRHLAAHQQVLRRLEEEASLLPLRFGTVVDDSDTVRHMLVLEQERFLAQLHRVAGKIEMGLRVTWDVPNVFEYFVDRRPELCRLRDECFGGQVPATEADKIELGRVFDVLLAQERQTCVERVRTILARCCAEIKENACRNEREVMNLACLAERGTGEDFEAAVAEAAGLFDNSVAFTYSGPWAPHHFVDANPEISSFHAAR